MSTSPEDMRYPTDGAALPGESVISESDLAQIVDDHQVALWRYLRALGCDSSEADDLLQDTFLMILRKPFRYVNRAATASYLRRVAYHRFISAKRRQGKEIAMAELDEVDHRWEQWLSDESETDELLERLKQCFKLLSDRAKFALQMRFRDKLSRAEIASHLAITEHGAKNLMQRAKQKLRECIESKQT